MTNTLYKTKDEFWKELSKSYSDIKEINTSGGGGVIYSAYHERLQRKVILKKIRARSLDVIKRDREMKILTSLSHSYLPQIYDFWSFGDEVYTVMEYIEGHSLKELLDAGEKFSEAEVIKLTRELADVVSYLHSSELHIIHSDIKPANIMLTCRNRERPGERDICLIDFNISVLQESGFDETIGYTAGYAPVEQLILYELFNQNHSPSVRPAKTDSVPPRTSGKSAPGGEATTLGTDFSDAEATTLGTDFADSEATTLGTDSADGEATTLETDFSGGEATTLGTSYSDSDATTLGTDFSDSEATTLGEAPATPKARPRVQEIHVSPKNPPRREMSPDTAAMIKKYGKNVKIGEYTDIYSICATMYHLLTGKCPSPCTKPSVDIAKLCPGVNDAFARILMKGLEQDPAKRYQTSEKFREALGKIASSTKSFRRARLAQDLLVLALTAGIGVGAVMTWRGGLMKLDEYAAGKITESYALYNSGEYEKAAALIDSLSELPFEPSDVRMADAYYISGSCYLELGELDDAIVNLGTSLMYDSTRPATIRDYGIALARAGRVSEASRCLDQARARGIGDESLLFLEGELAASEGDSDKAIESLGECLTVSSNDTVKVRAALRLDTVYGEDNRTPSERLDALDVVAKTLPEKSIGFAQLCERQAQICVDAAEESGSESEAYIVRAVGLFEKIIDSGFSTLTERLDLAISLQRLGEYEKAGEVLLKTADIYQSYLVYKRLAFLELDRQLTLPNESRSYKLFGEYYNKCKKMYQESTENGSDMEMDYLDMSYAEAVEKGWMS